MSSEKNSETKPADSAAGSSNSSSPPSTAATADSAKGTSASSANNELITEGMKLVNQGIKTGGEVTVAALNKSSAKDNLAAADKILQAEREKTEREKASGKNSLTLQQDRQTHETAEAKNRREHEAAESTKKLEAKAKALAENGRQFDKTHTLDEAESNESIAVSKQKRETVTKYMAQCEKKDEIPVEALSAILSNNSMFAQRQRHNVPAPAAAPQPKGPSM